MAHTTRDDQPCRTGYSDLHVCSTVGGQCMHSHNHQKISAYRLHMARNAMMHYKQGIVHPCTSCVRTNHNTLAASAAIPGWNPAPKCGRGWEVETLLVHVYDAGRHHEYVGG